MAGVKKIIKPQLDSRKDHSDGLVMPATCIQEEFGAEHAQYLPLQCQSLSQKSEFH